ncbi:MAG: cytochrome D1 domain-containing protein [Myxococcota bacterium]
MPTTVGIRTFTRTLAAVVLAGALAAVTGCDEDEAEEGAEVSSADVAAGEKLFETKCLSCHTIGEGDRTGPDLAGVNERREHAWLVKWIDDPMGMGKTDPIGKKLLEEYNNVPMPPQGLSEQEIEQVLAYIEAQTEAGPSDGAGDDGPIELTEAQFTKAKEIYFNRCAGCHGTLRAGATGPNIQPERTRQLGTKAIKTILTNGTPGGMPAWGEMNILGEKEIEILAGFVQMDPPDPPKLPLADIKESWDLKVPVADRPDEPQTKKNWENYFGVVLRDKGQVAILDGDTHELVNVLDTGFAVHILRSSSSGRYYYVVGRDGRITMIDLWTEEPTIVAQVQGCFDARSVDGSKLEGYEDKYVIEGCYWPPQYVVYDGQTLEPLTVHDVTGKAVDDGEELKEVRVASIVASHKDPVWMVALKESGHVGIVDYSKDGFPMVKKIGGARFLHDGGWDHTGRYFMVAANMENRMVVVDTATQELVANFETGIKPHPGRGANWKDPEYGWVNATSHMGQGLLAVYGADPEGSPEHAWKVVRKVELPASGSLFVKTHPKSKWVWVDFALSNEAEDTRKVCVYSKQKGKLEKCWSAADHGRVVHFEYDKSGKEVWVSVWDTEGEIVIYDDASLKEKTRIKADWLVTPTGKFNVHNTARDVY